MRSRGCNALPRSWPTKRLLAGRRQPNAGSIEVGSTVVVGYYDQLGATRYYVTVVLFLMMMSLPVKMLARWLFNLKYIVAIPEFFFNI